MLKTMYTHNIIIVESNCFFALLAYQKSVEYLFGDKIDDTVLICFVLYATTCNKWGVLKCKNNTKLFTKLVQT